MLIPYALLTVGILIIQLQREKPLEPTLFGWISLLFCVCLVVEWSLSYLKKSFDPYLFPLAMFLTSIGMVMIYRLKPALFMPQLKWAFLGIGIFVASVLLAKHIPKLVNYKYIIGLLALFMLIATIVFGSEIGGSKNWIIIGSMQFQPSEFVKIAVIVFLAAYLIEHRAVLSNPERTKFGFSLPPLRFIAPLVLIWGMALLMFVLQRDLGSALLFFGIALFMTYMATGNLSYIAMAGIFFSISSVISYFLFSHVRVRIAIWLHPWLDPNGQSYQIIQSLFSFGTGGLFGTGLAFGHPEMIPEVHTDFIFSAIAEEFGLIGSLAVIFTYLLFLYRSFRIALVADNNMKTLLAAGIAVSFTIQIFIILAGITKLLPLTGITLPFISYGGSSMAAAFSMIGLLFSLSIKENNNE